MVVRCLRFALAVSAMLTLSITLTGCGVTRKGTEVSSSSKASSSSHASSLASSAVRTPGQLFTRVVRAYFHGSAGNLTSWLVAASYRHTRQGKALLKESLFHGVYRGGAWKWTVGTPPGLPFVRFVGVGERSGQYSINVAFSGKHSVVLARSVRSHVDLYATTAMGARWRHYRGTISGRSRQASCMRLLRRYGATIQLVSLLRGWLIVAYNAPLMNLNPGCLFETVDGGRTWSRLPTTHRILRLYPLDASGERLLAETGASGANAYVGAIRSLNAGRTWHAVHFPAVIAATSIVEVGHPFALGRDITLPLVTQSNTPSEGAIEILRSEDGGTSWSITGSMPLRHHHYELPYISFQLSGPSSGWALVHREVTPSSCVLVHTTNDGKTWQHLQCEPGGLPLRWFKFVGTSGLGWASTGASLLRTSTGGRSWTTACVVQQAVNLNCAGLS